MNTQTELGNEVRAEVKAILAKYSGTHEAIAGVKVTTLRKIDLFLNPEPEVFDLEAHQFEPSRDRPLAAAAAVLMRKGSV